MWELLIENPVLSRLIPFVVGCATAVVNVVAGGGSLLTIPLLMAMGLDAQVANATNRIGVLAQSVAGGAMLARRRILPARSAALLLLPSIVGTVLGAWAASILSPELFRRALAAIFFGMGVFMLPEAFGLAKPVRVLDTTFERPRWWMYPAFALIGFYGGFVQAGVGLLVILVLHVIGRVAITSTNAVKMVHALAYSMISLVIFAMHDLIRWQYGIWLALGAILGGWLGVRWMLRIDAQMVQRVIVVIVLLAASRMAGLI